jgi:hypothetical protein
MGEHKPAVPSHRGWEIDHREADFRAASGMVAAIEVAVE